MPDMDHLLHVDAVARADCDHLREKERTYQGSWKKRGGVGAFMMLARKWDRLENMVTPVQGMRQAPVSEPLRDPVHPYDIFGAVSVDPSGADGSPLAEIRDLRRYLLLVEAEMVARGVVKMEPDTRAQLSTAEEGRRYMRGEMVPVHAVGDSPPVPVEDSNRHADRAERPLSRPPRRPRLTRHEYNMLPVGEEREAYRWDETRGEWTLA